MKERSIQSSGIISSYSFIYKSYEEPAMEQAICQVLVILIKFPPLLLLGSSMWWRVGNSDKNNSELK